MAREYETDLDKIVHQIKVAFGATVELGQSR
jgi:hypothetical protein